jgi:hypothetical protein
MTERTRQYLLSTWRAYAKTQPPYLHHQERVERAHHIMALALIDRAGLPKQTSGRRPGRFLWAVNTAQKLMTERGQHPY